MDNMHLLHSTVDKQANSKYNQFVVDNPYRSDALSHYIADLERKGEWPGIVFVRTKKHAALLAGALSHELGRIVPAISSDVNRAYRESLAEKMRQRDPSCPVVVATAVWTTGLNIPLLSWVMMAGAGRAPVGLKQAGGRATRLADDKPGYTIYDVVDVGLPWAEEQSAERRRHYVRAGFSVSGLRSAPDLRLAPASICDKGESKAAKELTELLLPRMPERQVWNTYSGQDESAACLPRNSALDWFCVSWACAVGVLVFGSFAIAVVLSILFALFGS